MKARSLGLAIILPTLVVSLTVPPVSGEETTAVTLHADRTGHPISPYVYGQFIEHLGRCIYGGLWAEMIQDRKFFFPVDSEPLPWTLHEPGDSSWEGEGHAYELLTRSPWLVIGGPQAVSMVTEDAFSGEHSPRIRPAGDGSRTGLVQARISVIAGKAYNGRIAIKADPSARPIMVELVWGSGASDRQAFTIEEPGPSWERYPFRFEPSRSTDNARLEITSRGGGVFSVGAVSLMPSDNILGWRADTLALLRELDSPIYRWPGGNFVSGYDWRDGIGDRDRRPTRKNPAWTGLEPNDVGIHEFLDLCRLIKTEPYIAVNTGLGDADSAAAMVEYCNGPAESALGRERAENGNPQPFGVTYWAVGNEMYGEWQLGHMPLSEYVTKHKAVVEAMRAVDPSIQLVGVGARGEWSRTMLAECPDHMDLISEHIYWQDREDLVEHVRQVPLRIRELAEAHRGYRKELGLGESAIPIAFDEWNYWYGPYEFGELGTRYFLQDGLGIAAGLHEMFRHSDLYFMANYAQTVNVIGAIKTSATHAEMEATGLALQLYRRHFGEIPIELSGQPEPLDVSAAWTDDRTAITVGVVNPTEEPRSFRLSLEGAAATGKALIHAVTGPDRWSHNDPEFGREVELVATSLTDFDGEIQVEPLSATIYRLEVK